MIENFTFDYGQLYNPNLIGLPVADQGFIDELRTLAIWKQNRVISLRQPFEIVDPFNRRFGSYSSWREPFMANARDFIATAQRSRSLIQGRTVSDFAGWIYSLYVKRRYESSLIQGKIDEKAVFLEKADITSKSFAGSHPAEWTLVHNGIVEDVLRQSFKISSLTVDGCPLTASPDLVFQNGCHTIVIVEIKSTLHDIPSNLWPNVWAQLWEYSKIDYFRQFNRVVLIGEIWGRYGNVMYLRKSVRNDARNERFDKFFQELFDIYTA